MSSTEISVLGINLKLMLYEARDPYYRNLFPIKDENIPIKLYHHDFYVLFACTPQEVFCMCGAWYNDNNEKFSASSLESAVTIAKLKEYLR